MVTEAQAMILDPHTKDGDFWEALYNQEKEEYDETMFKYD